MAFPKSSCFLEQIHEDQTDLDSVETLSCPLVPLEGEAASSGVSGAAIWIVLLRVLATQVYVAAYNLVMLQLVRRRNRW